MKLTYGQFKKWLDESESINNGNIEHEVEYGSIVIKNLKHRHRMVVRAGDSFVLMEDKKSVQFTRNSSNTKYS